MALYEKLLGQAAALAALNTYGGGSAEHRRPGPSGFKGKDFS
jgi:hypothetical protein